MVDDPTLPLGGRGEQEPARRGPAKVIDDARHRQGVQPLPAGQVMHVHFVVEVRLVLDDAPVLLPGIPGERDAPAIR